MEPTTEERDRVEVLATALVGLDVATWFTDRNLARLLEVREHRDLWMQCYMQAKHARVEKELVAHLDELENMSRMTEVVQWSDLPDLPDDLWLVEGLIRRQGLSILAGDPKAGKSTLVAALVTAILHGKGFVDRRSTPGRVLYYSLEEIGAEVKERFRPYLRGDEQLFVREGYVPASKFVRILEADIGQHAPDFVIIDPLFDVVEVESANDYVPVNRAIKQILYVARKTGAHVCCIHHSSKGGTILGSQSLKGGTDCNIFMTKLDSGDRVVHSEARYGLALEKYYCYMQEDKTLKFEPHL